MKEYLKGLNFYEVKIQKTFLAAHYALRLCTYRNMDAVEDIFKDQKVKKVIYNFDLIKLDIEWILEEETYWFPMFCVELHNNYATLQELVEDIFVGKITGIIDVDLDKIWGEIK